MLDLFSPWSSVFVLRDTLVLLVSCVLLDSGVKLWTSGDLSADVATATDMRTCVTPSPESAPPINQNHHQRLSLKQLSPRTSATSTQTNAKRILRSTTVVTTPEALTARSARSGSTGTPPTARRTHADPVPAHFRKTILLNPVTSCSMLRILLNRCAAVNRTTWETAAKPVDQGTTAFLRTPRGSAPPASATTTSTPRTQPPATTPTGSASSASTIRQGTSVSAVSPGTSETRSPPRTARPATATATGRRSATTPTASASVSPG